MCHIAADTRDKCSVGSRGCWKLKSRCREAPSNSGHSVDIVSAYLCRSLLEAHGAQQLLVVSTGADALHGGVHRAARSVHQIQLGRALFDDTKVTPN